MGRKRGSRGSFRINARGWVYLVLTVSVGFAAGIKDNNLLFAGFSVLFGLFLVAAALTVLVARRMEVSRIVPEAVYAGDLFAVGIRFRNAGRLLPAFCLRFQDRLTHDVRPAALQPTPVWLPLAHPGKRIRGSYYAIAHQRGWAQLGPLVVTSEFMPGLFTYSAVIPLRDDLLVLPRPAALNRRVATPFLARAEYSDVSPSLFVAGDETFAGVRDYRPGDSPRHIHWKMSARVPGRLVVRDFEDPRVRDAVVLLDTFLPNSNDPRRRMRLERAITFAATLVETLLAESYRVRFRAFGPKPVELTLEPHPGALSKLLYALAVLKPTRLHPLGDLLATEGGDSGGVRFLLKVGDEPLPAWEPLRRSRVIDTADMRALMHSSA